MKGPQFHIRRNRLIEALKTHLYKVRLGLSRDKIFTHSSQKKTCMRTTVSVVLKLNSGIYTQVFVNILLYM